MGNYTYRGEGIINFTSIKSCEWVKRARLPNGRISFNIEKDITSCGKSTDYINDFFVVVFSSQQLVSEEKWKELTQYFGINDRFESPVDSRAPQKVTVDTKAMSACTWP